MAYVIAGLQLYLDAKGQDNANDIWEAVVGSNATLVNHALNNTSGFNGTADVLDGTDDCVSIANWLPITSDVEHTFELDFKLLRTGVSQALVSFGGTNSNRYFFRTDANNLLQIGYASATFDVPNVTFDTTRTHLIVTRKGTTWTVKKNGITVATLEQSLMAGNFILGQSYRLGIYYSGGRNANVEIYSNRWYNRALTDEEAVQNYNDVMDIGTTPVTNDLNVTAPIGMASAQGYNPALVISKNISLSIPIGTASASAYNPSLIVAKNISITLPLGTASTQGYNPSVTVEKNVNLNISLGTGTAQGYVPTLTTGEVDRSLNISSLLISTSANVYNPTISAKYDLSVQTSVVSVSVMGYTPNVSVTKDTNVNLGVATVSTSAYLPSLDTVKGLNIEIDRATVTAQALSLTFNRVLNVNVSNPISMASVVTYLPNLNNSNITDIQLPLVNATVVANSLSISVEKNATLQTELISVNTIGFNPSINTIKNVTVIANVAIANVNAYNPNLYTNVVSIIFAELNMKMTNEYNLDMIYSNASEFNMNL